MTGEHASGESSSSGPVVIESKVGSARTKRASARRASASTARRKGKAVRESPRPPITIESSSDDTDRGTPAVVLRRQKRGLSQDSRGPRPRPAKRLAVLEEETKTEARDRGPGPTGDRVPCLLQRSSRADEDASGHEDGTGRLPASTAESSPSYRIIFREGSYSRQWDLGADDSAEILYDDVFGKNSPRTIWLEGLLVSRHLSVSENGFFPGTNYVTLSDDDREGARALPEVVVQVNSCSKSNLRVPFDSKTTAGDVLTGFAEPGDLMLVFNGLLLKPEETLSSIVEDGDVVDVVRVSRT